MDTHKAEKAERNKKLSLTSPTSIVSLFRGAAPTNSPSVGSSSLVQEMNQKMEAVLEDALLRNIQLQVMVTAESKHLRLTTND